MTAVQVFPPIKRVHVERHVDDPILVSPDSVFDVVLPNGEYRGRTYARPTVFDYQTLYR